MLTFQTGQFHKLKAIVEFNFGPLNGISISEGTEMEFDGTTLRMNGTTYPCPQFSLALKAKFVVPMSDDITTYQPAASKVQVKSATSLGETREAVNMGLAVEDETVVGSVSTAAGKRASAIHTHTQQVQQSSPQPRQNLTVEEADKLNAAALQAELNKPVTKGYVGGNLVNKVDQDDEGGTPVRTVGGGRFPLQMADGASQGVVIGQVKSGVNSARVGRDGEAAGRGRPSDVTRMTVDSVESGLQAQSGTVEGIRGVTAKTGSAQTGIRNVGAQVMGSGEPIRHTPPKPMQQSTLIVDGEDIRVVRANGSTGDVSHSLSGEELHDLLPEAAVASPPRKAQAPKEEPESHDWDTEGEDAEIQAILTEWDKKRHWQKRVSEAVQMYGDWPEFLEALYEVEVPSVVKHIKARLAHQGT